MCKSTTTTLQQPKHAISRTSSLLLSPSKRKPVGEDTHHEIKSSTPTPTEIYRWTFSRTAIASCLVSDVHEMRDSGFRDLEFFWLGRIPCRTVCLVGLTVAVQIWEKRTVYTIDDGTGVVDCALAHAQVAPCSPAKPKRKSNHAPQMASASTKPSFSDYLLSARTPEPSKFSNLDPPPPPSPVAHVGHLVRIVGRVISRHDMRTILVDQIERCSSPNDEPSHWLNVSKLRRTVYFPSDPLPPFVPPPLNTSIDAAPTPSASRPGSPTKHARIHEPATPSNALSSAPSTTTSPSTSVGTSSPGSSNAEEQQVPRLRHPSRLHTRDLTANTFRLYIKHYMDNTPPPPSRSRRGRERFTSPSPTPRSSKRQRLGSPTPTKSQLDATPRPSRRLVSPQATTSQPRSNPGHDSDVETDDEFFGHGDDQMYGFTLSHLRRVPELALLSWRVVKAEERLREKEERKKGKSQRSRPDVKSSAPSRPPTDIPVGVATKRLFQQVIRTLFSDGAIVLWSGPVHPLPVPAPFTSTSASAPTLSSDLWKASANASTSSNATSLPSASRYDEWDEDDPPSDPAPHEEAYVPLTPAYLSRVIESAIRTIMAHAAKPGVEVDEGETEGDGERTPRAKRRRVAPTSLIERLRAAERKGPGPPPGPTKAELFAWLQSSDERWARVGEWAIEEALEWGRREGRLWCVGQGRWELCG